MSVYEKLGILFTISEVVLIIAIYDSRNTVYTNSENNAVHADDERNIVYVNNEI